MKRFIILAVLFFATIGSYSQGLPGSSDTMQLDLHASIFHNSIMMVDGYATDTMIMGMDTLSGSGGTVIFGLFAGADQYWIGHFAGGAFRGMILGPNIATSNTYDMGLFAGGFATNMIWYIPQAAAPDQPLMGLTYFNSTDSTLRLYNGAAWVTVTTH